MPKPLCLLFLGLLQLGLVALSGCTAQVDPVIGEQSVNIGDTAVYSSSSGARLSATVVGPTTEVDPWANRVAAIRIQYEFIPQPGWPAFTFFEAIDPDGRIVAQRAQCVAPLGPGSTYRGIQGPGCGLARTGLYFGGWGWPGGLGASATWFGTIDNPFTLPNRAGGETLIDLRNEAAAVKGCREVSLLDPGGVQLTEALPMTLGFGRATLCPGQPFPIEFQSSLAWSRYVMGEELPPRFALETFQRGNGLVQRPTPSMESRPAVQLQETGSDPYLQNSPDRLPFGTWDALSRAAEADSRVSRFAEENPEAVPVASMYSRNGESQDMVSGATVRDERRLWLASEEGKCLAFSVQRNRHSAGIVPSGETVDYGVTFDSSFPACPSARFNVSGFAPRQMTYELATQRAAELTGLPEALTNVGYSHIVSATAWTDPPGEFRIDGYALYTQGKDPDPERQEGATGTLTLSNHYDTVFHGPSGALLFLEVPPGRPALEPG